MSRISVALYRNRPYSYSYSLLFLIGRASTGNWCWWEPVPECLGSPNLDVGCWWWGPVPGYLIAKWSINQPKRILSRGGMYALETFSDSIQALSVIGPSNAPMENILACQISHHLELSARGVVTSEHVPPNRMTLGG